MTPTPEKKNKRQRAEPILQNIKPKTKNQHIAFDRFEKNQHLVMTGYPGTGKTLVALYLACRAIDRKQYERVIIVRSAVPTRDMGFLPGSADEKAKSYEVPYAQLFGQLYNDPDTYNIYRGRKTVEFMMTSFVRGITIDNAVIVIDEAQNMDYHELSSIISRLGENSRLIVCGDLRQDDLTSARYNEVSGLSNIMEVLRAVPGVAMIEYTVDDIIRSPFVKDFIIAKDKYERSRNEKRLPHSIRAYEERPIVFGRTGAPQEVYT